ncbi:MAG TPA: alkaline phosphatase family protein [Candidatus Limnocylindrales bacterium]|nr:alkaline phosphatase family protein [Candidatus Limnocylindrales bacterium]
MKILVIGLDGATPEVLFGDERLDNFRRLMEAGCYGRLETVIPPHRIPAWMCMATGQDPGSLGTWGLQKPTDSSPNNLEPVTSKPISEPSIWNQIAREGKRTCLIGVPLWDPPQEGKGVWVSCPLPHKGIYTYPASVNEQIRKLIGSYPADVKHSRFYKKDQLLEEIYTMSRKHFQVVRYFLQNTDWDYFQWVEIGPDRLQHGFWRFHDPQPPLHEPGNPYQEVIRDYYLYLDHELGAILDLLSEDTLILVISCYGVKRLEGGFCLNEWLVREGLLVLNEYPQEITAFNQLSVNWEKTLVCGEGGYAAGLFFNVKGREPRGTLSEANYEKFRDEIRRKLKAISNDQGKSLEAVVLKPEEIYTKVRPGVPDLLVQFGGFSWRVVDSVGHQTLYLQGNDPHLDDCNHGQFGSFILVAPDNPLQGEIEKVRLPDMAPTLLELGGYSVPSSMQGKSLRANKVSNAITDEGFSAEEEEIIRERLSGLGYIG